jgi:hypothetical protein
LVVIIVPHRAFFAEVLERWFVHSVVSVLETNRD